MGLQYARWELSTQHADYVIGMQHAEQRERVHAACIKQVNQKCCKRYLLCSGSYIACRSIYIGV